MTERLATAVEQNSASIEELSRSVQSVAQNGVRIADVARERAAAGQLALELLESLGRAGEERHPVAAAGEPAGEGGPGSGTDAGDQTDSVALGQSVMIRAAPAE